MKPALGHRILALRYGALRRIRNVTLASALALPLAAGAGRAEPVTVAALGDSLTQGYGLPVADGFVPQLQRWLDARGVGAVVVNAGVSGDTTAGGLARLDWTLDDTVDALIVNLGGNDMLRGIDPAEARANLEAIVKAATGRGLPVLLVAQAAPGNYGPDYKAAFDAIFPDLAASYGVAVTAPYFTPLLTGDDPASARPFMQGDGIHPNAEGVARIVDWIGPQVEALVATAKP